MNEYLLEVVTEEGYGVKGIGLEKIFSLAKVNGNIIIREECDGYFSKELTPEQAIELFNEAIAWVSQ